MRNKTDKRSPSQRMCDRAVEPIITKAGQWGYTVVLTRHVSKRLCRKVHRNVVDTWLNLDRDQRVRPDYGTVIILLLAAEDTDAEFDKKRKATSSETNRA